MMLKQKHTSKPSKEDLLLQFQSRSNSSKSKLKTFTKTKTQFKTSTLKSKHASSFTKSFSSLSTQQKILENELQAVSLQILENDEKFITTEIKKLNERNKTRKHLFSVIKLGNVQEMNELWKAIPSETFTDLKLEDLDSQDIIPSEIVDTCSKLFQDEFAAEYYLNFVELFLDYKQKSDDLKTKIVDIQENIENDKILHSFATVVCSMIPKTDDHYIKSRSELMKFFMKNIKSNPVDQINACNRIEQYNLMLQNHQKLFMHYNSDKNQLRLKINAEISEKLKEHQNIMEKEEKARLQAENCVKLHDKLKVMRDEFMKNEVGKFLEEDEREEERKIESKKKVEAERNRRLQDKIEIEKLKISKKLGEMEIGFIQMENDKKEREENKVKLIENIHRTNFRRGLQIEKEELRLNKRISEELEKLSKEEKLEKLRQGVRDELGIDEISYDSERLVKDTKASLGKVKNRMKSVLFEDNGNGDIDLFPLNGFKSDQIMQDPRTRLENALRSAGVNMQGDYARNAMGQFQAAPQKHTISSLFR